LAALGAGGVEFVAGSAGSGNAVCGRPSPTETVAPSPVNVRGGKSIKEVSVTTDSAEEKLGTDGFETTSKVAGESGAKVADRF